MYGRQPMDVSLSCRCFSLSLPSSLSKINKHILGWGLKMSEWMKRPAWSKVRVPPRDWSWFHLDVKVCHIWFPALPPRMCVILGKVLPPFNRWGNWDVKTPSQPPAPGIAKLVVLCQHKPSYYSKLDSNQWEGQRNAWTFILPILYAKNWMNICQHSLFLF